MTESLRRRRIGRIIEGRLMSDVRITYIYFMSESTNNFTLLGIIQNKKLGFYMNFSRDTSTAEFAHIKWCLKKRFFAY